MYDLSSLNLPVWRDVDAVVVGASSGAVSAALELRRRGLRVMVLSDLSYFGEETAGALNLWPAGLDRSDSLIRALFPEDNPDPCSPASVKRALESALIGADVPFLYLVRPVALLRTAAGEVEGVVVAARSSLFVVRCRSVIDASRHGIMARLAGIPLQPRPALPETVSWIVFSRGRPEGWRGGIEELVPPFTKYIEGQAVVFNAYKLWVERCAATDDLRGFEHRVRSTLYGASNLHATADIMPVIASEYAAQGDALLVDRIAGLPDSALSPAPGIFLLNGLLPVSTAGALELERADMQIALGRRVGGLAAISLAGKSGWTEAPLTAATGGDLEGTFGFAQAFLRHPVGYVEIDALAFPSFGSVDVVVAGGGTGGAPAGISAARAGVRTVVLETQHGLGGIGTTGLISAYWYGNRVGFTTQLDKEVNEIDDDFRNGVVKHWRPEIKSSVYHRMLENAGGSAWLGSYAFGVRMAGDRVDGVLVSTPFGCGLLETGCVVDATGNADIAAAAGAPCRVMGAEHLATQGTGLSPCAKPDTRICNSDWTFIDETDPEGITAAFAVARAKFTAAFDTSTMVNSRERRQIIGEYEISPLDILSGRTFPDTVFTAASNFDTHGFIVHPVFMVSEPAADYKAIQAHVPFRCMLPRGIEGVIVTGLGMSAHRDALPVLRMQADVQNQGFAAGLAAAWSVREARRLRDLDIGKLQQRLVETGILTPDAAGQADSFPLSDQSIADAAAGALRSPLSAAILFANPEKSRPLLQRRLESTQDAEGWLDAALILGLMGFPEAAPLLAATVRSQPWDEGWNFKGMHQNGASMSRLDAAVLALARTREPLAVEAIIAKIRELGEEPAFSHCRFVAIATLLLHDDRLTRALAEVLRRPGIRGHALRDLRSMIAQANDDLNETSARNTSLRELYLARGLYLAGDLDGLGRSILETYTRDMRGHFARFARAVLEQELTDAARMMMT